MLHLHSKKKENHSTDYGKCIHVHMSYDEVKSNYLKIHQKPQKEPAKQFVCLHINVMK